MALYFAARGIGKVRSGPDAQPEPYTSPTRVLLNGLGSDELLGGYGRHRTAFQTGGWPAVIDEVGHRGCLLVRISDVIFLRSAPTRDGSHPDAQSRPGRSRDLGARQRDASPVPLSQRRELPR